MVAKLPALVVWYPRFHTTAFMALGFPQAMLCNPCFNWEETPTSIACLTNASIYIHDTPTIYIISQSLEFLSMISTDVQLYFYMIGNQVLCNYLWWGSQDNPILHHGHSVTTQQHICISQHHCGVLPVGCTGWNHKYTVMPGCSSAEHDNNTSWLPSPHQGPVEWQRYWWQ